MLPKRTGLPSTSPAQSARSRGSAYIGPLSGTGGSATSVAGATGGTVRSLAVAPSTPSMPRATCRASSAVAP